MVSINLKGWQHWGKFYAEKKEQIGSTLLFIIPILENSVAEGYFLEGRPLCDLPSSPRCLRQGSLSAQACRHHFQQGKDCSFFFLFPHAPLPSSLHTAESGAAPIPFTIQNSSGYGTSQSPNDLVWQLPHTEMCPIPTQENFPQCPVWLDREGKCLDSPPPIFFLQILFIYF